MEHAHCWGTFGHWSWIVPLLVMILICAGACRLSGRRSRDRRRGWSFRCCGPGWDATGDRSTETPDRIIDRRYASGEITREDHARMKRDLESPATDEENQP
jgi:hypothetical protein